MKNTWMHELDSLIKSKNDSNLKHPAQQYEKCLNERYQRNHTPAFAVIDMENISRIQPEYNFLTYIYESESNQNSMRVRIYQVNNELSLSEIMPVLHNFGLDTLHESRYQLEMNDKTTVNIIDLSVKQQMSSSTSLHEFKASFEHAMMQVMANGGENDGFNRLVLAANLDINTINIIRSYSKYLKQIKYRYSQSFIEKTLEKHVDITKKYNQFFYFFTFA